MLSIPALDTFIPLETIATEIDVDPKHLEVSLLTSEIFEVRMPMVKLNNGKFQLFIFQNSMSASLSHGHKNQTNNSLCLPDLEMDGNTILIKDATAVVAGKDLRLIYDGTIVKIPFGERNKELKQKGGSMMSVDFNVNIWSETPGSGFDLQVSKIGKVTKNKHKTRIPETVDDLKDTALKWKVVNFTMIHLCRDNSMAWLNPKLIRQNFITTMGMAITKREFQGYLSGVFVCGSLVTKKEDLAMLEAYLMSNPAIEV